MTSTLKNGVIKIGMIYWLTANLLQRKKLRTMNSNYTFWDEMWNVPPKSEEDLNKEKNTDQEE
jgi:hypothetical protein